MPKFDSSKLNQKNYKPTNPVIFQTAADMAAQWFEIALSSGMPRGKYVGRGDRPIKMFVAEHLEKFIPLAISILIDMLKPTSNCNAAMREMIHKALTDPLNDPELMLLGKKPNVKSETNQMVLNAIRNFDKNKITQNILTNVELPTKLDLKSSTSLGNSNG